MKKNFTAWMLENGIVGIPKNLIGFMEPLGLNFEDLGKITYIFYCGCNNVKKNDSYALNSVKTLERKNILIWNAEEETVDFSPMYNRIVEALGGKSKELPEKKLAKAQDYTYAEILKSIEKKLGRFLSIREKKDIQLVTQRYTWSYGLVREMFLFYQKNLNRSYSFVFFAQMAFGAKVDDVDSFNLFCKNINYTYYKVVEIKRLLGHKNNPTEIEKECYLKWVNEWKFSHEIILEAVKKTIYAVDPSFKYLDSVLFNWNKDGIKTKEALNIKTMERKKMKGKQVTKKSIDRRTLNDLIE